jgi:dihydrofolate reductase
MITLIAAMDDDHLIGRGETMPWHEPEDLKHFRRTTMGHTVIMGRHTWEGFADGQVLDGRVTFVVTRKPADWAEKVPPADPQGPHFVDTIELAIRRARREFPEYVEEFFIAGGRQIYELALRRNLIDRMLISHIHGPHMGDVYFPQIPEEWIGRSVQQYKTFEILEYVRKP